MTIDWRCCIESFLRDAPDAVMAWAEREERSRRCLAAALGNTPSAVAGSADADAAFLEALPAPKPGLEFSGCLDDSGSLRIVHPLSGEWSDLGGADLASATDVPARIARLLEGLDEADYWRRFLTLWRCLPAVLAGHAPFFRHAPADRRFPDHTIWNHGDIETASTAAGSAGGSALFTLSIGPVQSFIAAARSVRDLWTGSMILSYLSFAAMLPVIEATGPTAILFPSLRGNPFLDRYLRRQKLDDRISAPSATSSKSPCLPNRFLALIPWGQEGELARAIEKRCRDAVDAAWRRIADAVKQRIRGQFDTLYKGWDSHWDAQIAQGFQVATACLPEALVSAGELAVLLRGKTSFDEAFPRTAAIKALASALPADTSETRDIAWGRWQALVELSARMLEGTKCLRHGPAWRPAVGDVPPKCSMYGSFEQMGPAGLDDSARFWADSTQPDMTKRISVDGVLLRENERFCAPALVKRFAGPAFFRNELGLGSNGELRFPDTATVAARCWLEQAGIDPDTVRSTHGTWNGQWLHQPSRKDKKNDDVPDKAWKAIQNAKREAPDSPPIYYAVLMLDGDEMGKWLQGLNSPLLREVLHPDVTAYFESLQPAEAIREGLSTPRPVSPAFHAAISEALSNFSLYAAPAIVERHKGTLIYSGGDDVLALLPVATAPACARELHDAFQGKADDGARTGYYRYEGRDLLMMGPKAGVSAGLGIVHHKEDLREAIEIARAAEKKAKQSGRNILCLSAVRGSGGAQEVLCPWGFVPLVEKWVQTFVKDKPSDRWTFRLARELEALRCESAALSDAPETGDGGRVPWQAVAAEIGRQFGRSDQQTRLALTGQEDAQVAAGAMMAFFTTYWEQCRERRGNLSASVMAADFVRLWQIASFMARGRDK